MFFEKIYEYLAEDDGKKKDNYRRHILCACALAENFYGFPAEHTRKSLAPVGEDSRGISCTGEQLSQRKVDGEQCRHHDDTGEKLRYAEFHMEQPRDGTCRHADKESKQRRDYRIYSETEHEYSRTNSAQRKCPIDRKIGKIQYRI